MQEYIIFQCPSIQIEAPSYYYLLRFHFAEQNQNAKFNHSIPLDAIRFIKKRDMPSRNKLNLKLHLASAQGGRIFTKGIIHKETPSQNAQLLKPNPGLAYAMKSSGFYPLP